MVDLMLVKKALDQWIYPHTRVARLGVVLGKDVCETQRSSLSSVRQCGDEGGDRDTVDAILN